MFEKINFDHFDFAESSLEEIDNIDNKDIRDINNNTNIDNNRFAFKGKYYPKNEITHTAYEIAKELNDLNNYAFYISAVKKLTPSKAKVLLLDTLADIEAGKAKGKPIRNPGAVFNWKVKNHRTSYEK